MRKAKNQSSPPEFEHALVTGDIIRTGSNHNNPNQNSTINWLYSIVSPALRSATRRTVRKISSDPEDGFEINRFYSLCHFGMRPNGANWAHIFSANSLSAPARNFVYSIFAKSLVVGFELPEIFRKVFDAHSIPYLDLTFHPIRYTPELTLGIRTNNDFIRARLIEFAVDESEHYVEATLFRSNSQLKKIELVEGALLAGQTIGDRVTISGSGYTSLVAYKDEIVDRLGGYDRVYFKRHPLVRNDHELIRFLCGLPNIKIIDENIYDLLCSGVVQDVYSLCSGVSVEAKYFGLNGHMFYKSSNSFAELEDCSALPAEDVYYTIKGWLLDSNWWSYLIGNSDQAPRQQKVFSSSTPLRDTLKQNWGLRRE